MVLLHKSLADIRPNGPKRAEPNQHPALPPPARMKFTLNPFKLLTMLAGPQLAGKMGALCVLLICIVLGVIMLPQILGNVASAKLDSELDITDD
eukprot:SAG22_NODE_3317_length_1782_cov_51.600713_1_plen_94_part_00